MTAKKSRKVFIIMSIIVLVIGIVTLFLSGKVPVESRKLKGLQRGFGRVLYNFYSIFTKDKTIDKTTCEKIDYLIDEGKLFLMDGQFDYAQDRFYKAYLLNSDDRRIKKEVKKLNEFSDVIKFKEKLIETAIRLYSNNKKKEALKYFKRAKMISPYDETLKIIIDEIELEF